MVCMFLSTSSSTACLNFRTHQVVLAFFDVRAAVRAHALLSSSSRSSDDEMAEERDEECASFFGGRRLASRFVSFAELYKVNERHIFSSILDEMLNDMLL